MGDVYVYIHVNCKPSLPQYPHVDVFEWRKFAADSLVLTRSKEAPATPKIEPGEACHTYVLGEAVRFDWVRSRIAHLISLEYGGFQVEKKWLLNEWPAFQTKIGVTEQEAHSYMLLDDETQALVVSGKLALPLSGAIVPMEWHEIGDDEKPASCDVQGNPVM